MNVTVRDLNSQKAGLAVRLGTSLYGLRTLSYPSFLIR